MPTRKQITDPFTLAYIEAALWSSTDNSDEQGGDPLDQNYGIEDIADDTLAAIEKECAEFQATHGALLEKAYGLYKTSGEWSAYAQAGHDFWLTRNHHGAGFWDRGIGKVGELLTEASHAAGERDIYVGDDGRLYI